MSDTGKREGKKPKPMRIWTVDDLCQAMKGKSEAECTILERDWWIAHGTNPDTDLYSPEERAKRFEAGLKKALSMPSITQDELRKRNKSKKTSS